MLWILDRIERDEGHFNEYQKYMLQWRIEGKQTNKKKNIHVHTLMYIIPLFSRYASSQYQTLRESLWYSIYILPSFYYSAK